MSTAHARDYSSLPERDLVACARAGDSEAFGAIMTRCNQRLFRVARAVAPDEAEAEDVLQEAYTRAFCAMAGFRGEAGVATWLTRIVLNEARGRLRRRRNTVNVTEIEAAQQGVQVLNFPGMTRSEDPEAETARAQVRRSLEHAIGNLPEPFRLVFMLRDVEELSVDETAAHLGLRPETVKTRLHRARRRLRETLDTELADVKVGAFPFLGARCERITRAVLRRLADAPRSRRG